MPAEAIPDGFADILSFAAGADLDFEATVVAKGRGGFGGGGLVDLAADGNIHVASTAEFELTGAAAGGDLMLESGGRLDLGGEVDVSASSSGLGGRVVAVAAGDLDLNGHLRTAGGISAFSVGDLIVEGCRVNVSGDLFNAAAAGRNRVLGHHSIAIVDTATLLASGAGGSNILLYRDPLLAPTLDGTLSPWPDVVADPQLEPCALCGNGQREDGEDCDDGNEADGDGCSSVCRDEACGPATSDGSVAPACQADDVCAIGETCLGAVCEAPAESPLQLLRLRMRRSGDEGRDWVLWKMEFPRSLWPASPGHADLRAVLVGEGAGPVLDVLLPAGTFQTRKSSRRFRALFESAALGPVQATLVLDEKKKRFRLRLRLFAANLMAAATAVEPEGFSVAVLLAGEGQVGGMDEEGKEGSPEEVACIHSNELRCRRSARRMVCGTSVTGADIGAP